MEFNKLPSTAHFMLMRLTRPLVYSAVTHAGLERDNNEDCFLSLPEQGIWLVADGMGGHEAGEVASAIVRETFQSLCLKYPNTTLTQILQASHRAILLGAAQGKGATGMGSTAVALKSRDTEYEIAWVGDSRAYLWSFNEPECQLEQLTCDHSYVQMLLQSGAIAESEVEHHPQKNVITQCLGSLELNKVNVDTITRPWKPNQWLLLCSDGLTDEVNKDQLMQLLSESRSTQEAATKLIDAALAAGAHDNITLQIIESPLRTLKGIDYLMAFIPHIWGQRTVDLWIYVSALLSLVILLIFVVIQSV